MLYRGTFAFYFSYSKLRQQKVKVNFILTKPPAFTGGLAVFTPLEGLFCLVIAFNIKRATRTAIDMVNEVPTSKKTKLVDN